MQTTKLVSLAAAVTATGLAGWMGIMRFFPEYGGVRPEHVNRWLIVDGIEFTTLAGSASTAHRRPRRSRGWALGAATVIAGDALADVSTSRSGHERRQAVLMAALVEVPCSLGLGSWALIRGRNSDQR
ncbi:hypothetical protein SAMN05443377_1332 [Propionibacterium cyclohexanicum]|uniref:DUF4267 domain-containing protein n=1 Tax=Propionibacterium cyclohexanicum TaxID=64702 RepID=A0A1H9TZP8_9ACTN|nr:hypothetical protein [Propionibacterium cyclohexanicum]SES02609.1 hypothetical protein SAMN05443377_1332 [Propionibacterium cyclohexanicum]